MSSVDRIRGYIELVGSVVELSCALVTLTILIAFARNFSQLLELAKGL